MRSSRWNGKKNQQIYWNERGEFSSELVDAISFLRALSRILKMPFLPTHWHWPDELECNWMQFTAASPIKSPTYLTISLNKSWQKLFFSQLLKDSLTFLITDKRRLKMSQIAKLKFNRMHCDWVTSTSRFVEKNLPQKRLRICEHFFEPYELNCNLHELSLTSKELKVNWSSYQVHWRLSTILSLCCYHYHIFQAHPDFTLSSVLSIFECGVPIVLQIKWIYHWKSSEYS